MFGGDMREVVNILIVEDDEIDVESLKRLFDKKDIKNPIYRAANGVEALENMRGQNNRDKVPKPYDENLKDTVVFILTTSPRDEDKSVSYKLNVAGYFLKQDIKELVNLLSLYWQLNEFPEN